MDKEFSEKCLNKRIAVQEPSVREITDKKAMESIAEQLDTSACSLNCAFCG